MKSLYYLLFGFPSILIAQDYQFQLMSPIGPGIYPDIEEVLYRASGFSDIDNDGDQDLIILGRAHNDDGVTILYRNNGSGKFTAMPEAPFPDLRVGDVAFVDVDNDNDPDLLISGKTAAGPPTTRLYLNNGKGIYSLAVTSVWVNVEYSDIAFADVDNDNDQDLLISGKTAAGSPSTRLYLNDGGGKFTPASNQPFTDVYEGEISFADVDGDNDKDVLITGTGPGNNTITELYANDGSGGFTLVSNIPFFSMAQGDLMWGDIDNDGDQDVIMSGDPSSGQGKSEVYLNDGSGSFTLDTRNALIPLRNSALALLDVDNDNDLDLILTGYTGISNAIKLYTNNGTGVFTEVSQNFFKAVKDGILSYADIDGDQDLDVLLSGSYSSPVHISRLYLNDGAGIFDEVPANYFEGFMNGDVAIADFNNDNKKDILISGTTDIYRASSKQATSLYLNSNGNFTHTATPFPSLYRSSLAYADIDNDNDLDVFIMGTQNFSTDVARLYVNNGSAGFTVKGDIISNGAYMGSADFADVDNDGDQDLVVSGQGFINFTWLTFTKLYLNDGSGNFTEDTNQNFTQVYESFVLFEDVDNDNDPDLLVTGLGDFSRVAEIYQNDGSGNFSQMSGFSLQGISYGAAAFADIDNDNDPDLLLAGQIAGGSPPTSATRLYTNDGSGIFTEVRGTPFPDIYSGAVAFADMDQDNDQDLLIVGGVGHNVVNELYVNNGTGSFSLYSSETFESTESGEVVFTDLDNDTYPDVLLTGFHEVNRLPVSLLYRNIYCPGSVLYDTVQACRVYSWPATNMSYSNSGNYTFKVKNFYGCDTVLHLNLSVIDIKRTVSEIGLTLIASDTGGSYQWLDCQNAYSPIVGATDSIFEVNKNGSYAVAISRNGCTDTSQCIIINNVSLPKSELGLKASLYPNPVENEFTLLLDEENTDFNVRIYNSQGLLILQREFRNQKEIRLDFTAAPGLYYIYVISGKGSYWQSSFLKQ